MLQVSAVIAVVKVTRTSAAIAILRSTICLSDRHLNPWHSRILLNTCTNMWSYSWYALISVAGVNSLCSFHAFLFRPSPCVTRRKIILVDEFSSFSMDSLSD
jgi:hypothetical protein